MKSLSGNSVLRTILWVSTEAIRSTPLYLFLEPEKYFESLVSPSVATHGIHQVEPLPFFLIQPTLAVSVFGWAAVALQFFSTLLVECSGAPAVLAKKLFLRSLLVLSLIDYLLIGKQREVGLYLLKGPWCAPFHCHQNKEQAEEGRTKKMTTTNI